jgi:peptide/nickel transport system substrate-binding protein
LRRTAKAAIVLLGASLVAAACGGDNKDSSSTTAVAPGTTAAGAATSGGGTNTTAGGADTTVAGKSGGTVTYSLPDNFTSYNNGTAEDNLTSNQYATNQVLPNVSYFDEKGGVSINKELADVQKTSDSPLTVVYKFNPKAVWDDGAQIGCDDMYLFWVANNGVLKRKDDSGKDITMFATASTTGFNQISKVDCSPDGSTVTYTYSTPFTDWLGLVNDQGFVPAHVVAAKAGLSSAADIRKAYEAKDTATMEKVADFWSTGFKTDKGVDPTVDLSGGPYKIQEYVPDQTVTLVRNDKYWGTPAKADKIVMRIITDDVASAQALANKEVQVIAPQPDPDLLNQLKGISGVTTATNLGFTFEHFDVSFLNPLFQDQSVRQAIAYCLPRQEIVDKLIKPMDARASLLQNRMFEPFQKDYYKDTSGGQYDKVDIAKAKAALEAGGWKLNGNVYEKSGQKLEFKVMHKLNARRTQQVQLMQASCSQAGMSVLDDGDANWSTRLGAGQYDSVFFGWQGNPQLTAQIAEYKTPPDKTNLLSNYQYYSNPEVDKLLDSVATQTDPKVAADALNQVDTIMWKDLNSIPLYQFPDILAVSDEVHNVIYNPSQQGPTWNIQQWAVA